MFSAKIIYENTIFAKKIRACGAKMKDLAKILENKGVPISGGFLFEIVLIVDRGERTSLQANCEAVARCKGVASADDADCGA